LKSDNEVVATTSRTENWDDEALHDENGTSVTHVTFSDLEESENGLHYSNSDCKNNELKDGKDDGFFESDDELSDDDDVDNPDVDINQYHESRIKHGRLSMAIQGFRREAIAMSIDDVGNNGRQKNNSIFQKGCSSFDPDEVEYNGTTFAKKHCYILKNKGVIVGIRHFVSDDSAECILVVKFENTILGIEDAGIPYKANHMLGTYVQVHQCIESLHLSKLGNETDGVKRIPRMIYQPQTPGNWYTFGYFYDPNKIRKLSSRQGRIRTLEVFAGAGGSLLGYTKYGFETVLAIENDQNAVQTLKANNPELKVYDGCITKFLEFFHILTAALGPIDHIHFSSPCQDFSSANRFQPTGEKRERADLSLLLIDLLRKTSCSTAVFENVVGIWQRNNIHYMKIISKEIMKLGYQMRCTVLNARDYGDPQLRPRFFMFVSKNSVPLPAIPPKTHGSDDPRLWPFVTVKDALSRVKLGDPWPNMEGRVIKTKPGQHGVVRLIPHDTALTIRARSVPPYHYSAERCISVREAACLQSFPLDWIFCGNLTSQYRLVGNAMPVELSSAIAHSIMQVLKYDYDSNSPEEV